MFTKKRPQPRSLRTGTRELPRYASKSAVSKSVQTFSHSPFPLSPIYSLFLFFLIYAYLGKHGDGVWCGPPQETLNTGLPMVDLIRCCMRYFVFLFPIFLLALCLFTLYLERTGFSCISHLIHLDPLCPLLRWRWGVRGPSCILLLLLRG